MRLFTLLRKEGKIIGRSHLLVLVLILYPLILVAIIGYAFSQPNQRVPIAVVNEDTVERPDDRPCDPSPCESIVQSPIEGETSSLRVSSRNVTIALANFADLTLTDRKSAEELLLTGDVQAIIVFPKYFADNIASLSTNGELTIIIDQSDPVRAKFMEVLIRGIVQEFQEKIVREKVRLVVQAIEESVPIPETRPPPPPGDSLYPGFRAVRQWVQDLKDNHEQQLSSAERSQLNATLAFLDNIIATLANSHGIVNSIAEPVQVSLEQEESGSLFIRDLVVPAALGLSIFWTGTLATSSLVVYERESPAYTRLRITPTSTLSIYGSKVLLTLFIILAQALAILLAAVTLWNTRVDNLLLTFVVILLSTFASIGLGIFLSGISRDVNGTVLLSVLVTFPMLFLAGLFYPVSFMPKGAQALAQLFPLTYAVSGLRGSMLRGFTFEVAQGQLLALFLFGIILTALGVFLGRRLERQR